MFRKPQESKLGLKTLVYGTTGVGKTRFMLTFPDIAALDAEAGISFYEGKEAGKNLVLISNTQSYQDVEDSIDYIKENFKKEGVKTFAVDSTTKIKENLEETIMTIDERRERRKGKDVNETNLSIRSRGRIKYISNKLQNLKIDLSSQGVNIVDIAQAKEVKKKVDDNWVTDRYEPDMQKGSEHDYDVVLFLYTKTDSDGNEKYYARVDKDRTEVKEKGDIIENPTYDIWKKEIDKRAKNEALDTRFSDDTEKSQRGYESYVEQEGKTLLERIRDVTVNLSEEDKDEFKKLLKDAKITDLKNLDKLTPAKKDALIEILDKFN